MPRHPLSALPLLAAAAGVGYLGFALARVRRFAARPRRPAHALPAVSILKPLYGVEDGLFENLCSFCEQDYPDFEVVLGVGDAGDPALEIARRVAARFPDRARLAIGDGAPHARNPKVANLTGMLGIARDGEIVVIADADMRVAPGYLRSIVAPFEDSAIGAVTCLYAGSPQAGVASILGAMFINEQFAPSVLVAGALEPLRYCFGATIALRRSVLDALGGFAAVGMHVADDHLLGKLVTDRGLRIALSDYVVENIVSEPDLRTLWSRELRWSRTIRSVRPLGHAFSFLTFGLPLAAVAALLSRRNRSGAILLGAALALRVALHYETNAALGVPRTGSALLIPLRDALSLAVWVAAFFDRAVDWRGQRLELDSQGDIL